MGAPTSAARKFDQPCTAISALRSAAWPVATASAGTLMGTWMSEKTTRPSSVCVCDAIDSQRTGAAPSNTSGQTAWESSTPSKPIAAGSKSQPLARASSTLNPPAASTAQKAAGMARKKSGGSSGDWMNCTSTRRAAPRAAAETQSGQMPLAKYDDSVAPSRLHSRSLDTDSPVVTRKTPMPPTQPHRTGLGKNWAAEPRPKMPSAQNSSATSSVERISPASTVGRAAA
mmetsp:Transcript_9197/g.35976  ORF Transcript_9197/g.35976 Transcript_9197/m.35976 type:complete len:229 (+) Transcript_9197:1282-1968(+)